MTISWHSLLIGITLASLTGCQLGEKSLEVPKFDAANATEGILKALDKDGDQSVSLAEAAGSAGILAGFARFDSDGNNALARDEIQGRFTTLSGSGVGILNVGCTVTYKGKPLEGALVKFIPEPFLGNAIQPAEGTTDGTGFATPTTVGSSGLPGMQFGIYRVEISHPSVQLPATYNAQSTLGCDISPLDRGGDRVDFILK